MDHLLCTVDVGNAFLESKLDVALEMSMPRDFNHHLGIDDDTVEIVGDYGTTTWTEAIWEIMVPEASQHFA
jgi:hypothetical protein